MKKMMFSMLAVGAMALCGLAMSAPNAVAADDDAGGGKCFRTKFDTKLTGDACAKGGQGEAKKAWKAWVAEAKKTEPTLACKACHTKMGPEFPLEKDALDHFKKLGGK
jgi:hypothetical protein